MIWRFIATGLAALAILILLSRVIYVLAKPIESKDTYEIQLQAASAASYYPNCRFGIGGSADTFSTTQLNMGWYMDWSTRLNPAHPNGAEYVQVIHLNQIVGNVYYSFYPPTSTLYALLDQNPGATWLIGNEPDSPYQDNVVPDAYAQLYHQVYSLIKQHDPVARVGAGSIVQPTPLRMQYLDRVLTTYRQLYGQALPTDLWSIHSYILREISPYDPDAYTHYEVWGADVPPGIAATRGILYNYSDMFSLNIFKQRLIDFRTWMSDRGYHDTPLYITEYGTLFPYPPFITGDPYVDENGVPMTEVRTAAFMTGTFNILSGLADANLGYPADSNRMVQHWLWYSISDTGFGGPLFDPDSRTRRPLGDAFAAYTSAISSTVDWLVARAFAEPSAIAYAGVPVTATLRAQISNAGNISTGAQITVTFYDGPIGQLGTHIISYPQTITPNLRGCADNTVVSATWSGLDVGLHRFAVQVQTSGSDVNLSNNVAEGTVLVATHQVWLPLVLRVR